MTASDRDSTVTCLPSLDRRGDLPLPGQVLGGRFRLEGEVGRGGSGGVYCATDLVVRQRVAIKVIDPALVTEHTRARLQREVSASRPAHPNAVTIYELYDSDGFLFLAMELVEGASLRDRLRDEGPLTVTEVIELGRQVAAALAHLHNRGIVHRDVKPGNILLEADGTARLCDTGLARPLGAGATVTESQMVVGTPAYMAPEQATASELTAASDVYALGLTLHACLTGSVPHVESTAMATLMRRARSRPPRIRRAAPHCPRWLARLLRRMLEPRPGDRPTAADVATMLASGRVWPRPRRRQWIAAAAVVVAAVAAAGTWQVLDRGEVVRVEAVDGELRGIDDDGQSVWRHPLEGSVRQLEQVDLDADGVDEAIVVTGRSIQAYDDAGEAASSQILIVDRATGHELTRLRPQEQLESWPFPYAPVLDAYVQAVDLDGDGRREVIATCSQTDFYPTTLFIWWPRVNVWRHTLNHSGRIYALAGAPDAAGPGLVFLGVNNVIGLLPVVGDLRLDAPSEATLDTTYSGPCSGPPGTLGRCGSGVLQSYTLLEESLLHRGSGLVSVRLDGSGAVDVEYTGGETTIDPLGNPSSGPNEGRDLRELRRSYFVTLARLMPMEQPLEVASVVADLADAERTLAPVLTEAPYRAALGIIGAQALARLGAGPQARTLLDRTVETAPYEGVQLVRAQLAALAGELDSAAAILRPVINSPETQRGRFDAPVLLLRLAVEQLNRAELARCVAMLSVPSERSARGERVLADALWARAHLWWDETGPVDCQAEFTPRAPAGPALAALARWRLGRSSPGDAAAMAVMARDQPDAAGEARLALAAAQLAAGDTDAALAELTSLIQQLTVSSRTEFADRQLLDLAGGLLATAEAAAGDCDNGRATATELLATATPGLLPAILAHESLERCRG